jgi:hypothetical protein
MNIKQTRSLLSPLIVIACVCECVFPFYGAWLIASLGVVLPILYNVYDRMYLGGAGWVVVRVGLLYVAAGIICGIEKYLRIVKVTYSTESISSWLRDELTDPLQRIFYVCVIFWVILTIVFVVIADLWGAFKD